VQSATGAKLPHDRQYTIANCLPTEWVDAAFDFSAVRRYCDDAAATAATAAAARRRGGSSSSASSAASSAAAAAAAARGLDAVNVQDLLEQSVNAQLARLDARGLARDGGDGGDGGGDGGGGGVRAAAANTMTFFSAFVVHRAAANAAHEPQRRTFLRLLCSVFPRDRLGDSVRRAPPRAASAPLPRRLRALHARSPTPVALGGRWRWR